MFSGLETNLANITRSIVDQENIINETNDKIKIQVPTKPVFQFESPKSDQTYEFILTVRGPRKIIDEDTVRIKVYNKNIFPVADAGLDQTVDIGDPIILNGSTAFPNLLDIFCPFLSRTKPFETTFLYEIESNIKVDIA